MRTQKSGARPAPRGPRGLRGAHDAAALRQRPGGFASRHRPPRRMPLAAASHAAPLRRSAPLAAAAAPDPTAGGGRRTSGRARGARAVRHVEEAVPAGEGPAKDDPRRSRNTALHGRRRADATRVEHGAVGELGDRRDRARLRGECTRRDFSQRRGSRSVQGRSCHGLGAQIEGSGEVRMQCGTGKGAARRQRRGTAHW